ncbi:hypothetical protein FCULG_00010630 [Fusarium culmorum]|uniref:Uncharacterized protein n=1 Tax=Fusarium culmorum TaxID=5516 RepID=A0A2T4GDT1_FUSCU|nr:hypothetical protein FCULG_00010630 [Fusarium culmorum]
MAARDQILKSSVGIRSATQRSHSSSVEEEPASSLASTDKKDKIVKRIQQDLINIQDSFDQQTEHGNSSIPASIATWDLWTKLHQILDHGCTRDDAIQATALLKVHICHCNLRYVFYMEPEKE